MFLLCSVILMSQCHHWHFLLYTDTDWTSVEFRGCSYCHQQMNWLHFERSRTKDMGAGYDRIFELTSNWCWHVVNDFTYFTILTASCMFRAGESITQLHTRSDGGII